MSLELDQYYSYLPFFLAKEERLTNLSNYESQNSHLNFAVHAQNVVTLLKLPPPHFQAFLLLQYLHVIGRLHLVFLLFHQRSEEHTSELQSRFDLVCRLLLEKKKKMRI